MSRGARWTLGTFCLFFAWAFYETYRHAPLRSTWGAVLAASAGIGLCLLIAFACFFRFGRGAIVRFFGVLVFLSYVAYFLHEIGVEPGKAYTRRSQPHWINALLGLIFWGLPGLYIATRGLWPNLQKRIEGETASETEQDVEGEDMDDRAT